MFRSLIRNTILQPGRYFILYRCTCFCYRELIWGLTSKLLVLKGSKIFKTAERLYVTTEKISKIGMKILDSSTKMLGIVLKLAMIEQGLHRGAQTHVVINSWVYRGKCQEVV